MASRTAKLRRRLPPRAVALAVTKATERALIAKWAKTAGLRLRKCNTPEQLLSTLCDNRVSLAVLASEFAGSETLELVSEATLGRYCAPVLLLTDGPRRDGQPSPFEAGVRDLIRRPVTRWELWVRSDRLLQGDLLGAARVLTCGPLKVDPSNLEARVGRRTIDLRRAEFRLLMLLMRNRGRPVSMEEIALRVLRDQSSTEATRNQVWELRQKLAEVGCRDFIQNVRGAGYRVACPGPRGGQIRSRSSGR